MRKGRRVPSLTFVSLFVFALYSRTRNRIIDLKATGTNVEVPPTQIVYHMWG